MKKIYDFEREVPPALNENILREKQRRRSIERQTALITVGGVLILLCIVIIAVRVYKLVPWLSAVLLLYVCVSVIGGLVISLVFNKKRRMI